MRSVFLSMILASSLGACATVSMVSSEAVVETGLSTEQSSLREVSEAYTDLAERKHWVAKSGGLLGFARVLMDGASGDDQTPEMKYSADLKSGSTSRSQQVLQLRDDIESATHGLNVATMEAEKLQGSEASAKRLRADLVSYESALVTAKKARRTFVSALADFEQEELEGASDALTAFDQSIDSASDAADTLADYAADRKRSEATS
ncbi:MAG: hypothetical protein NXH78_05885 [Hyphomonadaceae bacterium]|nr:hypothetical protein [Hyphomonadaceae bacterium]